MGTDLVLQQDLDAVVAGLPREQREYLLVKAMGCGDSDSRKLSLVTKSQVDGWRKHDYFSSKETAIESSEGSWSRDALSVFLDGKLPYVIGELLGIIMSGADGERPHKDKEKAIEFYLKELCGVSKAVKASTNFEHFIIEMRREDAEKVK